MEFGFEVRGPDGSVILDTTTWGWQFITTIYTQEVARDVNPASENKSQGSIVFDGQNGRPYVPADAELYAMNVLNQRDHPEMVWNTFYYETSGAYRKLRWSAVNIKECVERTGGYDSDYVFKTRIYVFSR